MHFQVLLIWFFGAVSVVCYEMCSVYNAHKNLELREEHTDQCELQHSSEFKSTLLQLTSVLQASSTGLTSCDTGC